MLQTTNIRGGLQSNNQLAQGEWECKGGEWWGLCLYLWYLWVRDRWVMIIICRSCQRKYEFGMTLNDTSTITITPPGCSPLHIARRYPAENRNDKKRSAHCISRWGVQREPRYARQLIADVLLFELWGQAGILFTLSKMRNIHVLNCEYDKSPRLLMRCINKLFQAAIYY